MAVNNRACPSRQPSFRFGSLNHRQSQVVQLSSRAVQRRLSSVQATMDPALHLRLSKNRLAIVSLIYHWLCGIPTLIHFTHDRNQSAQSFPGSNHVDVVLDSRECCARLPMRYLDSDFCTHTTLLSLFSKDCRRNKVSSLQSRPDETDTQTHDGTLLYTQGTKS